MNTTNHFIIRRALLAFIILLFLTCCALLSSAESYAQPISVYTNNLSYQMNVVDGGTVSTTANGKPKVLIFSGEIGENISDDSCYNTLSLLKNISVGFESSKIDIICGFDASEERVRSLQKQYNVEGLVYCYDTGSVFSAYRRLLMTEATSCYTPLIVYIDANNKIIGYSTGYMEDFFDDLRAFW